MTSLTVRDVGMRLVPYSSMRLRCMLGSMVWSVRVTLLDLAYSSFP